jgi:hypothetical protein
VKISHAAARALDRYLRARARHAQARQPQLWLGIGGLYQAITRRGHQRGLDITPHCFTHTWLDNGGAEGDLMELNGWASPRCPAAMGPAHKTPAHAPTTTLWTTPAVTDSDHRALMHSTATTPNAEYARLAW